MPKISFISPSGHHTEVTAATGETLLQIAHKNNIPIEGACGGAMACSTCHVIVAPEWFDKLPPATRDEQDMLELATGLTPTSRLGCQIKLTPELDGLVVRVPEESKGLL